MSCLWWRSVRLALLGLLFLTAPALADPGTLGALTLAAIGVEVVATSTTAVVAGNIIITAAVLALSIGVQAYMARQAASDPRTDGQQTTRQPTPSRRRGYGQIQLGGAVMFSDVAIVSGLVTYFRLVALHQGEIDAFVQHRLDDHHSLFSGGDSGTVVTGEYHLAGTPFVALETTKGVSPATANATLVANFGALWTANHRGDGIATALVTSVQPTNFENFTTVYPGGAPPDYRAEIRASKVWDPRDGAQSKDNPATWTWKKNAVLAILDLHRHADGFGLAAFDDVLFTSAAITQDWIPAANACDEAVGGISRYHLGGSYSIAEETPASVLAKMLAACDGQTYQRPDGALGIRVGKTVSPAITLDDKHILGYSELKEGSGPFRACNEVTAKYTSPAHDYQLVDADAWRNEADITDSGEVRSTPLALDWVQQHSQARRLMKIAMARANPPWQGKIVTDMAGLTLINERYVHLTINEVGLTSPLIDADFEIAPDSFQATVDPQQGIRCSFAVIAMNQSAYDWNEGLEAGTPPAVPPGV